MRLSKQAPLFKASMIYQKVLFCISFCVIKTKTKYYKENNMFKTWNAILGRFHSGLNIIVFGYGLDTVADALDNYVINAVASWHWPQWSPLWNWIPEANATIQIPSMGYVYPKLTL